MGRTKIVLMAGVLAAAILVIPALLPAGPTAALDASTFLNSGRFLVAAGVIFFGGLLTSLTPCVYPLIPITVSVFGARKAESRAKAVLLTGAYVGGMGAVFSILGVVAALSGKAFGSALGNPLVVAGLAVFLLVLAASMFGAFELALPAGLATRLSSVGGSGLLGALLMGSVAGFLAAPCTGPVLTGVLAFVAQSQDPALGGALLFIYALGIGVPFFLLGVFTVRLPKSGVWMEWVKSFFGVALVALAVSYLRDAWPAMRGPLGELAALLGRWPGAALAAAMVFAGVWLGAIHRSFKASTWEAILKGTGVLFLVAAVLIRGAATNGPVTGTMLVHLGLAAPAAQGELWQLKFPPPGDLVLTLEPFEAALAKAKAEGKPVMIDFFAEWCEACKELDRDTYAAAVVREELERFVNIKIDSTAGEEVVEQLWEKFGVKGLPTVTFIDSQGQPLSSPRVTGFMSPEPFLRELQKVK